MKTGPLPLLLLSLSCAKAPVAAVAVATPLTTTLTIAPRADETHFAALRQLSFGGENAEAYWSSDGTQLIEQARRGDGDCDRIQRLVLGADPMAAGAPPTPIPVSDGKGTTTCSYFLPGDQDVIFASTELASPACPPRPDHSKGYVWALYEGFDIFRAKADGSGITRLTDTPGYDAEGTVCSKDGSIIFTSVRGGDIDLWRMDADGKNVKQLTNTPGYDGGAFFNRDCTKIVWRASRPKGKALDEYKELLAQGLVRPTQLELYVADADGSNPQQVTYLGAASFAPFFFPSGKRIIFSSNYGDPKGREFDLFAIDVDGSHLERITHAPGFDGFPIFSPDGKYLAFSSNRATPEGKHDTNVFVARWSDLEAKADAEGGADRAIADVNWLADPAREGRGVGTVGLTAARDFIADRFKALGLAPAGDEVLEQRPEPKAKLGYQLVETGEHSFLQRFPVTTSVEVGGATALLLNGKPVAASALTPLGFSASGAVKGKAVLANYGVVAKERGIDDYAKLDAKGKIVVVRRFVAETPPGPGKVDAHKATEDARRDGDLRHKAWLARERGAKGLVVVDWPASPTPAPPDWKPPTEAHAPAIAPEGYGDAGIPVAMVTRDALAAVMPTLEKGKSVDMALTIALTPKTSDADNVIARLPAGAPEKDRLPGVIVIGAHYDHLGMGGRYSLAPEHHEPHLGADDNASGVAAVLEIARTLAARKSELRRDVVFIAFSGEESGVLGSTWLTRKPPEGLVMKDIVAMLNLDMVGRLRANQLAALGGNSASEWQALVADACSAAHLECTSSGDGYGPSDQTPFYAAGIPVLFFFTGPHADYHKPSDAPARINAAGISKIAEVTAALALAVGARAPRLTYQSTPEPAPRGDARSFNASLGTIPDYSGPPNHQKGVLLSGVRAGGGAERAGMQRGDILIKLGDSAIGSVEDLMYVLNAAKPGETVSAIVIRDGKDVKLEATFQEGHH